MMLLYICISVGCVVTAVVVAVAAAVAGQSSTFKFRRLCRVTFTTSTTTIHI